VAESALERDLAEAWEQCYLDPGRAAAAGRRLIACGAPAAAWGWLHVALSEARVGEGPRAREAMIEARNAFEAQGDSRGLALVDEVLAIQLRREGDAEASLRLHAEIDQRADIAYTALDQFIAHNSRAVTCKVLGRVDDALRHFHAARDAAEASGNAGAVMTALGNLGGYQQDLYNLEDARDLSERAFHAARAAGSWRMVAIIATNLIVIHAALGAPLQAREMAEFLLSHAAALPTQTLTQHRSAIALGHLAVGEIDGAERWLGDEWPGPREHGDGMAFWSWLRARCALARGDAAHARDIAEATLQERAELGLADSPYDLMELHKVLADACELLGDAEAALQCVRRVQDLYEHLVGRSARARRVALQVGFELARAQRERAHAVDSQRAIEADRQRLAELNAELERRIAENRSLQAQLREQALRDPLTGLHNRRYLFEVAPGLLERARRQGSLLAVVLLDLDHFKLLNDTYGHQAGDLVLQRFAALLAEALRKSDIVCRHGGEEFVALLPDIDAQGAEAMLERLLLTYQAEPHEHGRRRLPRCTFSAGIALFPDHGSTLEQLLSRADRALYRAKQQGRSRIEQVLTTGFSTLL
jgi:diguanylate cyclase (GGDEF)-like protein